MKKMQICGVEFVEILGWESDENLWRNVYNSCGSRKTNTKKAYGENSKEHEDAVKAWEFVREVGVKNGWTKGGKKEKYPWNLDVESLEDWQFDCKRKDNVYNAWYSRWSREKDVEKKRFMYERLEDLKTEKKRRAYEKAVKK